MDTVRWAFETALAREGKEVTDHMGTEHLVLFRRNKDKNALSDNLTFFHRADDNIEPGYTLTVNQDTLIVLNSEHESGTVYLRSDAVRANGTVSLCYVGEMLDEKFDTITTDIEYAKNVPIYIISGVAPWRLTDMTGSDLQFIMPARYQFSLDNTVIMNILEETRNHKFKVEKGVFKPNSIDFSLMKTDADGSISGLLTIRGSADLRPRQ